MIRLQEIVFIALPKVPVSLVRTETPAQSVIFVSEPNVKELFSLAMTTTRARRTPVTQAQGIVPLCHFPTVALVMMGTLALLRAAVPDSVSYRVRFVMTGTPVHKIFATLHPVIVP